MTSPAERIVTATRLEQVGLLIASFMNFTVGNWALLTACLTAFFVLDFMAWKVEKEFGLDD